MDTLKPLLLRQHRVEAAFMGRGNSLTFFVYMFFLKNKSDNGLWHVTWDVCFYVTTQHTAEILYFFANTEICHGNNSTG